MIKELFPYSSVINTFIFLLFSFCFKWAWRIPAFIHYLGLNPLFQEVTAVPNPKAHIGQLCLEAKETKTVSTEPSANFITGGEKKEWSRRR